MMYCHQCGKEVNEDVKFCPYCGTALNQGDQTQTGYQNGGYQPINQQPPYQQAPYQNDMDAPSAGFAVLSFFVPIVGLVLYIVWNKEYPLKAKSCLKGIIAGVVLYVVSICCFFAAVGGMASQSDDLYSDDIFSGAVVETVPYDSVD